MLIVIVVSWLSIISFVVSEPNFALRDFQEIALLSQFEHENIVQYYGTDKVLFSSCDVVLFC
jgi:hypothetical protein